MASVLNRTTKQYIASAHTPDYPVADWIHNPDMSAVSGVPSMYWKITGDTVSEMSAAEKDAACLDDVKEAKCAVIDIRTGELIAAGFTYSGKTYSLSACAQDNLNAMYASRSASFQDYPIVYSCIDNTDKVSLADAAAVEGFYEAAYDHKRSQLDSGNTLKDSVRDATTVAEVEAITDSR